MKKKHIKKDSKIDPDQVMDEWLDKVDLSESIQKGTAISPVETKAGRTRIGQKVNLILPDVLINRLRKLAEKRGLGYQTLARMILMEKISEYEKKRQ